MIEEGLILPHTKDLKPIINFLSSQEFGNFKRFKIQGMFYHSPHPGMTCPHFISTQLLKNLKNSSKVYIPVHFVYLLLRLRRGGKDLSFKIQLKKILSGFLKSIFFSGIYATVYSVGACYLTKVHYYLRHKGLRKWPLVLLGSLFTTVIFIESKSRWAEITLYVFGQYLGSLELYGVKYGYITSGAFKWLIVSDLLIP